MKQHLSVESLYLSEFVFLHPNSCSHVSSNNSRTIHTQIISKPEQQKIYEFYHDKNTVK